MKRIIALLLCLSLLPGLAAAEIDEKKDITFPDCTQVTISIKREEQGNGSIVRTFTPETQNEQVTDWLKQTVNTYLAKELPSLPGGESDVNNQSRLDVQCGYSRTGGTILSFIITSRVSYHKSTVSYEFTTGSFDMATGAAVQLSDLFHDDEAFTLLSDQVRTQLTAYFGDTLPDENALANALDNIKTADFSMEPVKLTLHYNIADFYPGHTGMAQVHVYYDLLTPYMTESAKAQTDVSAYNLIALTFDDGPRYNSSSTILDKLMQYGAKASFFCVGQNLANNTDVLHREHDEGHTVADHSWDHIYPPEVTEEVIAQRQANREKFDALLTSVIGLPAPYMRAPGGNYKSWLKCDVKLPLIQWSGSSGDAAADAHEVEDLANSAVSHRKDGAIILMHDAVTKTADGLHILLRGLTKRGYLMVTVEDMMHAYGYTLEPDTAYVDACGTILKE